MSSMIILMPFVEFLKILKLFALEHQYINSKIVSLFSKYIPVGRIVIHTVLLTGTFHVNTYKTKDAS